jgi:nitroimidazol reductase NimA-like FMN-containing flavoprotein (pyridoxamine 5'-phosphate oxidase superfamily)
MIQEESTRHSVHHLLRQQQLGVLSTMGEGEPYASLVAYTVSDDDRYLSFVTPRATRKFANLSANGRVALLVNNSINRPEDFLQAMAVTATGIAKPVSSRQKEDMLKHYISKHPHLEEFARSANSELVIIRVERYILVKHFQNVTEFEVDRDYGETS